MAHQQTSQLDLLVADYVASFEKLDEMIVYETDPIAQQLAVGDPDERGFRRWRPYEVIAEPLMLEGFIRSWLLASRRSSSAWFSPIGGQRSILRITG